MIIVHLWLQLSVGMYGLSSACTIRVGQGLGAGQPKRARLTFQVTLFTMMILGALVATTFMLGRNYIGTKYNTLLFLLFSNRHDT